MTSSRRRREFPSLHFFSPDAGVSFRPFVRRPFTPGLPAWVRDVADVVVRVAVVALLVLAMCVAVRSCVAAAIDAASRPVYSESSSRAVVARGGPSSLDGK